MSASGAGKSKKFGSVRCPVCGEAMHHAREGKIEIDVCEEHGVWLDRGELEAICASLKRVGRAREVAAARRGRETGRLQAMFLGAWSQLLK